MKNDFKKSLPHADPLWVEHGYGTRFQGFQNLMRLRIRDILLVSSLYDLYVFEEDGRLYELIRSQYESLNLTHAPELSRVANGREAIELVKEEKRFDLIITTLHIEDMRSATFAKKIKEEGLDIPVVLLAFDNKELSDMLLRHESSYFDQIFIWHSDFRLLLAIIKYLEDLINVDHDTHLVGVQSILVIEDNIRFYSIFLPDIYLETMKHTQRLISEGINLSHKKLRQRARPKILLCRNYEEATTYYEKYQDTILGVLSDIDFPINGKPDPEAGLKFLNKVKKEHSDIPFCLFSTVQSNAQKAKAAGANFIYKNSSTILMELRQFMAERLNFGDFIFRNNEGHEVARAVDLLSLEQSLHTIPEESMKFHAERNHFSNWLKARTEFWLAHKLRPRKVSDFNSLQEMREDLIASLRDYRKLRQRGIVTDFQKESFDPFSSISKIGGGSMGGKARGLSFVNILINNYNVQDRFQDVRLYIPPAVVIGTDIFDQFLEENELKDFALTATDDDEIMQKILKAKRFPEEVLGELAAFLDIVDAPLAVRSSSLLEDSHNHPFAGVYETYMIPNSNPDPMIRLAELLKAIKKVYASTYFQSSKDYIKATAYHLEEEKMAVIIQKMIGASYNGRYYPSFSGVARSYNFYPIPPQQYSDGIVFLALGLGKIVVEGGPCVRYYPKDPLYIDQFFTVKNTLRYSQSEFYALDLNATPSSSKDEVNFVKEYSLQDAENDGTLNIVGSTYAPETDSIVDGISRDGYRVVTFAPILRSNMFPLSDILDLLMDMGSWGMGTPVEIEFAVNLSVPKGQPKEFALLQMRPMVLNRELEVLNIGDFKNEDLICYTHQVMGNGEIEDIHDIVFVDRDRFDRGKSQDVVQEIKYFNQRLLNENRRYILIGVGRWGSLDPWLGIPVNWSEISNARTIVEADFKDFTVMPSQGSHFFQNLNSFLVGYFTVRSATKESFVDWAWLQNQPYLEKKKHTRLLRFKKPVVVKMSGHQNIGIILKPEDSIGK
ncbi:PEP/pyruvate-binding domain-containing protein [bacterium]